MFTRYILKTRLITQSGNAKTGNTFILGKLYEREKDRIFHGIILHRSTKIGDKNQESYLPGNHFYRRMSRTSAYTFPVIFILCKFFIAGGVFVFANIIFRARHLSYQTFLPIIHIPYVLLPIPAVNYGF